MTDVLLKVTFRRRDRHRRKAMWRDTGRKQPPTSQGEKPSLAVLGKNNPRGT